MFALVYTKSDIIHKACFPFDIIVTPYFLFITIYIFNN